MGIKALIDAPTDRTKQLEKIIERQQAQIERLRRPRTRPSKPTARKNGKQRPFLHVFCGDSHGAYEDKAAVSAFLSDLAILKPKRLTHVGDVLEAGTFLAQHHVIGTVAESEYTFEDDVLAANNFWDGVHHATPNTELDLIEGNHDCRIEKACVTWALQKQIDAAYLRKLFSPEVVLNLEKRGIKFTKRTDYAPGVSVSGTRKLDFGMLVQHGESAISANGTMNLLRRLGTHVIHGNNHRLGVVYLETAKGVIVGMATGCLCQRRRLWNLTRCTDWVHGYGVMVVEPGKGFTCFPVPIIDGVSYLQPMAKAFGL